MDCETEMEIKRAMAEYNCELMSQNRTREELIAALMVTQTKDSLRYMYWVLTKKSLGGYKLEGVAVKFADWLMRSEYYQPELSAAVNN